MQKSKNNKGSGDVEVFILMFGVVIGFVIGGLFGAWDFKNNIKILKGEAITRNYAEWATEAKTGEVSFRWKENSK